MATYLLSSKSLAPVLVAAALFAGGCGGHYVNRGADLFADGRYVEAAEVFERTQHRLPRSDAAEQARYGLYRGATLFVLGDFAHAQSWLAYAYDVERANPGALGGEDRAYLDRVWLALEARYRNLPASANTAVAATQPPPAPVNTITTPPPPGGAPQPAQRTLVSP